MIIIDKVMQVIKEVVDPEKGLNVADLNMIKKVNMDDKKIDVRMVLTTPFVHWLVFLSKKSKTFQNKLLGRKRAELWRKGAITLTQLVDFRGFPLTLEQLEDRISND